MLMREWSRVWGNVTLDLVIGDLDLIQIQILFAHRGESHSDIHV